MQTVKKKASVWNLVLFAASDIIQCCFSVENQETLQRSLFLISSLNTWHSWVLFCFSSTYFSEMIWSTLIISALISPQSRSPVYSWLLDSYSNTQIPSLSKILKLNSSSTPNLFSSVQSQWMCFLPQLKIPKSTRSLKQRNKTGYLWPFLCHSIHETYQSCLQKNDSFFFSKSQQCSFRLLFPNWYLCYRMLLFSSILYVDIRIYLKWTSDCHSLASNWLWLLIRYRIKPLKNKAYISWY